MTTFVAHDQHAPTARAFAWAMRGIGLLGALVVVVLLLTGVLDVDDDRSQQDVERAETELSRR
ncbi:hypothetical protein EEW87_16945 [Janibacter melonis]|uniref:Uncharacterized protein n=1 Tax=Janibacter melonis TaxID=262209 RepID=A0A650GSQ4_9MICO|nr:hypothetical protein [Janibacter melonis]QGX08580.1 hypothetical protein EEW87_16945 [Janibacter melonis]